MCLSSVYIKDGKKDFIVAEEASRVEVTTDGSVVVDTLFGEKKEFPRCSIKEVNFLKNYIVLVKQEKSDARS